MWRIIESRKAEKQLRDSAPQDVIRRYETWKDIARHSGSPGLQKINGYHDEALKGNWHGYRSSRLGPKWRVIYQALDDILLIEVVEVNAHVYKKH